MRNRFLTLAALCSLICIGCGGESKTKIPSDPTDAFPDPIFRAYVLENFDTDGDGKISEEEALAVTEIDVSNFGDSCKLIKSLEGIQYFTNLTCLYCRCHQLTSLNVSKNAKLEWLDCANNRLTTLDVSKNTKLIKLDCSGHQLTSLDVSNNAELVVLFCNSNKLTSLDVSKNTKLISLYCSFNKLKTLDISKNTKLTILGCSSNQLIALDVSKNTELTELECDYNQLTTLDVSKNTELTYLWCENNQIVKLDLSKTNLGNSGALDCAPMNALKKVYLKKGWSIKWITDDWYRSSDDIPDHTEIIFVD